MATIVRPIIMGQVRPRAVQLRGSAGTEAGHHRGMLGPAEG